MSSAKPEVKFVLVQVSAKQNCEQCSEGEHMASNLLHSISTSQQIKLLFHQSPTVMVQSLLTTASSRVILPSYSILSLWGPILLTMLLIAVNIVYLFPMILLTLIVSRMEIQLCILRPIKITFCSQSCLWTMVHQLLSKTR